MSSAMDLSPAGADTTSSKPKGPLPDASAGALTPQPNATTAPEAMRPVAGGASSSLAMQQTSKQPVAGEHERSESSLTEDISKLPMIDAADKAAKHDTTRSDLVEGVRQLQVAEDDLGVAEVVIEDKAVLVESIIHDAALHDIQKLQERREHVAHVAAAAGGLHSSGQPVALAAELAEVAMESAAVVDATSAHTGTHGDPIPAAAHILAPAVASAAAASDAASMAATAAAAAATAGLEDTAMVAASAATAAAAAATAAAGVVESAVSTPATTLPGASTHGRANVYRVNQSDSTFPAAISRSAEAENDGTTLQAATLDPSMVTMHNEAARQAAAAAALHYVGINIPEACATASVATHPADAVDRQYTGNKE